MATFKNQLGLSLSGGGYRASTFHLGTLNKLHELGILSNVDVISTISGGSITGAAWCLHKGDYPSFHAQFLKALHHKNVISFVLFSRAFIQLTLFLLVFVGAGIYLLFTDYAPWALLLWVIMFILLLKFQFIIFPVSNDIERAYDKFFYDKATLKDLCDRPLLAIGSSNLQTGRPFTFSKRKMADSDYSNYKPPIVFLHLEFPVSRAVMASSCVPFAFTPVSIDKSFFANKDDYKRIDPKLIDGGVYDNQGIQKITQRGSTYECGTIITSDAGGGLSFFNTFNNTVTLLIRTVDLFMNRIKNMQMVDNIYNNVAGEGRPIAYLSLGWRLQRCIPGFITALEKKLVLQSVIKAHQLRDEWLADVKKYRNEIEHHMRNRINYAAIEARDLTEEQWNLAKSSGTNLKPLSKERIKYLIQHAENLTELQVKIYCPHLIRQSVSINTV